MKLTQTEVDHIANLARLKISGAEKEKFAEQLSSILEYVNQLKGVATAGVEETAQVIKLENALRADEVDYCAVETRHQILKNAPEIEDDLVKTKSVFG